jgi:hypothetical protein
MNVAQDGVGEQLPAGARRAGDDELRAWERAGWILLDGLIGTDEIDAAAEDLSCVFPSPAEYHADPEDARATRLGQPPPPSSDTFTWPSRGPGFRPEQHRWKHEFPMPGSGALNRLCVHPAIVDVMERVLRTSDLLCYQAQVTAKYSGDANYEQPLHTDRNHSWLPASRVPPWWHVESFLYLSDVTAHTAPTHLVSAAASRGRATTAPLYMPEQDPELYAAEQPAAGMRGSLLVYRSDVFHRAVDLAEPGGARFLLNVSYKVAGADWIGFHAPHCRSTSPAWVAFVERSSPRELELFGFPPPGHAVWNAALLGETALRYPKLDLAPWRQGLAG